MFVGTYNGRGSMKKVKTEFFEVLFLCITEFYWMIAAYDLNMSVLEVLIGIAALPIAFISLKKGIDENEDL